MNPAVKLAGYGLAVASVVGIGAVVGAAAGPIDVGGEASHDAPMHEDTMTAALPAGGLLVSQDGYTFEPDARSLTKGRFGFTIVGPDGRPVESYDELHDRELHLIVASRDLQHFAHVHPERDADGHWSVDLPDMPAGPYRAFADFQPAGAQQYTLGVDLTVAGLPATSDPLRASDRDHVDGFDVSLDYGATAIVTVRRDGDVVTTEPYLGAAGHLVALREGDLAYLHVHPLDDEPRTPVRFAIEVPSAGTYALFFDFQVDGVVRTARFVIDTGNPTEGHGHG